MSLFMEAVTAENRRWGHPRPKYDVRTSEIQLVVPQHVTEIRGESRGGMSGGIGVE
jgi:hypothetical protein